MILLLLIESHEKVVHKTSSTNLTILYITYSKQKMKFLYSNTWRFWQKHANSIHSSLEMRPTNKSIGGFYFRIILSSA